MIKSIVKNYKLDPVKIIISVVSLTFIVIFTLHFSSQENYIYNFDYGQHYVEFIKVNRLLRQQGLSSTFHQVLNSIRQDDYNLLSAFILSPFSFINTSRQLYLISILLVYYLPSYWLFLKLILFFKPKLKPLPYLIVSCLFILSPVLLQPILRNESSIDAIFLIELILYLYFKYFFTPSKKYSSIHVFIISLSLALLPLFHRWYLPFTLSFLFLSIFFSLYYKNKLSSILITFSTAIIFLIISGNLWKLFFLVDYSTLYHSYKVGTNFWLSLNLTFSYLSYFLVASFIISSLLLLKNNFYSSKILFIILQFSLCLGLFLRIQDMNIHHYYLIIIPLLLTISLAICNFKNFYLLCLFLLLIVSNFIYTTSHSQNFNLPYRLSFFSSADLTPWSFPYETKLTLQIISELSQIHPQSVYTISSQYLFNASALIYASCYYYPQYYSLCPYIGDSSYVAVIDGFPYNFPTSDYVLIYSSTKINSLDPALSNLTSFISSHPQNYTLIKEYPFTDSDTIKLYHLFSPLSSKEVDQLINSFP